MRNKTVETEPFKLTFKVFHKPSKTYMFFDALEDAVQFVEKVSTTRQTFSYSLKDEKDGYRREYDYTIRDYRWVDVPAPQYVVVNQFDDVIDKDIIEETRRSVRANRHYRYRWTDERKLMNGKRFVKTKHSGAKIKSHCAKVLEYRQYCGEGYFDYRNNQHGYFKVMRIKNEMTAADAHINEYGFNIVRAKRNPRNLPNPWNDTPVAIWDTEDSWKHHSKRRKQWIPT